MSLPTEPAENPKPVVKDKNPHNYRKVGYSMIIISVSLVIIALLSWGLADDYHFSSNIMALQEVDAMTPKSGYNIVMFDISQPVGAKLKMLDHADALDQALSMQTQDQQQNNGNTIQVLLFNGSKNYNLNLMQDAEVYIQTPKLGYNVILDNYPLAVGAQLTLASHEASYDNATSYQKSQEDQIQGQEVKVIIFDSNYKDNLKMITNSSAVGAYANLENQTVAENTTQAVTNQTAPSVSTNATNATSAQTTPVTVTNRTLSTSGNQSMTSSGNQTGAPATANMTVSANQTTIAKSNMTGTSNQTSTTKPNMTTTTTTTQATAKPNMTGTNQTSTTSKTNANTTSANNTVMIANGASATKGSCSTTDCFNPQFITIPIGSSVTWTNADSVGHTATSGKLTDNQTGTVFDSSLIAAGKSYTSPPFKTAGTYSYFCQVHPWMTGQITVVATSNPTSQTATTTKTVSLNETMNVNATGK